MRTLQPYIRAVSYYCARDTGAPEGINRSTLRLPPGVTRLLVLLAVALRVGGGAAQEQRLGLGTVPLLAVEQRHVVHRVGRVRVRGLL